MLCAKKWFTNIIKCNLWNLGNVAINHLNPFGIMSRSISSYQNIHQVPAFSCPNFVLPKMERQKPKKSISVFLFDIIPFSELWKNRIFVWGQNMCGQQKLTLFFWGALLRVDKLCPTNLYIPTWKLMMMKMEKNLDTLPETNKYPLNMNKSQKERIIFQPLIFRDKLAVSFREGISFF